MTKEQIIEENVAVQYAISKVISDLVDARLCKDVTQEAECVFQMETLLVGLEQHLQCVEDYLTEE